MYSNVRGNGKLQLSSLFGSIVQSTFVHWNVKYMSRFNASLNPIGDLEHQYILMGNASVPVHTEHLTQIAGTKMGTTPMLASELAE